MTAVKQEVCRSIGQKPPNQWSLENVAYKTEVSKNEVIENVEGKVDKQIQQSSDGVYIHGLHLEGA